MKTNTATMIFTCFAASVFSLFLGANAAHAQILVNFQASSFNATSDTLTDSVNGLVASAAGGVANSAGNGYVSIGSGFTFNADSVPGLEGLTSYTLAVSFTYNSGAPGGANAYQGQGAFGGDLPGAGDGDANIAITSDGGGQIVGSLGATNGNDYSVYDTANAGTFVPGQATGAVLVVNGNTANLYVNGTLTTIPASQGSFTLANPPTVTPFGYNYNGGTPAASGSYAFGIGTNTNGTSGYNALNGSFIQAEIYGSALTPANAESLSLSIANPVSAPEPSSYALLVFGIATLIYGARRRSAV